MELKLLSLDVEHISSQHIAWHQVGGELDALEVGINEFRDKSGEKCLGDSWDSLNKHMAVGKDGCQD